MDPLQQLKAKIDREGLWGDNIILGRNEFLTVKGRVDTNIYYIVSGSLRIYFEDEFEELVIRLGYRDNMIGALDSYLTGRPTEFNIQAIKKCEIKVLRKQDFMDFLAGDPESMPLWHQIMEGLIYQQLEREKDILIYSPRKRYQRVLARSPHLFQEIPNKHIASYLRMSPETLSRLKKS